MSQKKRNAPRTPAGANPSWADIKVVVSPTGTVELGEINPISAEPVYVGHVDPRAETIDLFETARDRLRRNIGMFTEADVTKRTLFAVLETLTPEQRAEVRRRLGE